MEKMFCRGTTKVHIELTAELRKKLALNDPAANTICNRKVIFEPPTPEATDAQLEEHLCGTCRKSRKKLASQAPCKEEGKSQ